MIHYHGTPITPRQELLKLAGNHFCVSFSDNRDADITMQIGQSVMWDNGAFSLYTRGEQPDWTKFIHWLEPRLNPPHWAVIPDVIDGTEVQQKELLAFWPHSVHQSAPVWHLADNIDYLRWLADRYPRICFGSSGQYWNPSSDLWAARIDEAFNALPQQLPWIHMLRAMNQASHGPWPFASSDSTNVAQNFKAAKATVDKMAARLNAKQPKQAKWTKRATQEDLFNLDASNQGG